MTEPRYPEVLREPREHDEISIAVEEGSWTRVVRLTEAEARLLHQRLGAVLGAPAPARHALDAWWAWHNSIDVDSFSETERQALCDQAIELTRSVLCPPCGRVPGGDWVEASRGPAAPERDRFKEHCAYKAHEESPAVADAGWTPTAENINALPEPLRRYVHDLQTLCDPAGIVAAALAEPAGPGGEERRDG